MTAFMNNVMKIFLSGLIIKNVYVVKNENINYIVQIEIYRFVNISIYGYVYAYLLKNSNEYLSAKVTFCRLSVGVNYKGVGNFESCCHLHINPRWTTCKQIK